MVGENKRMKAKVPGTDECLMLLCLQTSLALSCRRWSFRDLSQRGFQFNPWRKNWAEKWLFTLLALKRREVQQADETFARVSPACSTPHHQESHKSRYYPLPRTVHGSSEVTWPLWPNLWFSSPGVDPVAWIPVHHFFTCCVSFWRPLMKFHRLCHERGNPSWTNCKWSVNVKSYSPVSFWGNAG